MRALGWIDGWLYLFGRGLSRLSRRRLRIIKYHFVVQPLSALDLPLHRGRNIEVRELQREDTLPEELARNEAIIEARYARGGRCLAAIRKGEIAGFLWWVEGAYQEDEVRSRFVPVPEGKAVWDFDVHVVPRHRLSPVFSRLWQVASRELMERGFDATCSRILAFNPGSLAAHRRLGAERVGWGVYLLAGRVQLAILSLRPWLHISFSDQSFPVIEVGRETKPDRN